MKGQELAEQVLNKFKANVGKSIICLGPKGAGKTMLGMIWAAGQGKQVVQMGTTVDSIRAAIEMAQNYAVPIMFFGEYSKMTPAARNAMLKILEEPPKNVTFWLEAYTPTEVMDTIRSRSTEIKLAPYTPETLKRICMEDFSMDEEAATQVCRLVTTPGKAKQLNEAGYVKELEDFCIKIVDNVAEVGVTNSLKITDRCKFKDEEDGFDYDLVIDAVQLIALDKMKRCLSNANRDVSRYGMIIRAFGDIRAKCQVISANKRAVFDTRIMLLRKALRRKMG